MGVAWSRGAGERKKGEREGARREELERGEDMKITVFWGELNRVSTGFALGVRGEGRKGKEKKIAERRRR